MDVQVPSSKIPSPGVVPGGYNDGDHDDDNNSDINLKRLNDIEQSTSHLCASASCSV